MRHQDLVFACRILEQSYAQFVAVITAQFGNCQEHQIAAQCKLQYMKVNPQTVINGSSVSWHQGTNHTSATRYQQTETC